MSKVFFQAGRLCLTMALCLSFASCNKDEFYQKEFLESPFTNPTGEEDGGVADGGATGGSAGESVGGVNGGAGEGSTTGSVTGGAGEGYNDVTEHFQQSASHSKKLDIVWVIDDSGSMIHEQDQLGINFNNFIKDFITKNVDFKMGITTTDTKNKPGVMVTGSDIQLTSAKASENKAKFLEDFNSMVRVGTAGHGTEQGLAASNYFMEKNADFLRPEAYLAVVILSDEEDQSANAVDQYTDFLKLKKSSAGLVKVYSIVDINKTNSGAGISVGGDRYIAASAATAGVASDIREDFAQVLAAMGDSIINLLDSFALAANPVPGSLKVYVNNQLVTNYSYDEPSRSIRFDPSSLPQVGANIKVTYKK